MEFWLKQGGLQVHTKEEAFEQWQEQPCWRQMEPLVKGQGIHFCKAEVLPKAVLGEIIIPKRLESDQKNVFVTYYLEPQLLTLVADSGDLEEVNALAETLAQGEDLSPIKCFLHLLDEILKNDTKRLQEIEAICYSVEEKILEEQDSELPKSLAWYRKVLLAKSLRYQQLEDLGITLEENVNDFFSEREVAYFHAYGQKAGRLHQHAQMLRETVFQIGELQQQRLEVQRSNAMRILTVVAAFFSPLSLIAGWYGMNFRNMPELYSAYGYYAVIAVCAVIVIAEIIYFKKKDIL